MKCPMCGYETDLTYCPNCGTYPLEQEMVTCPKCGHENSKGLFYCSRCGASIITYTHK